MPSALVGVAAAASVWIGVVSNSFVERVRKGAHVEVQAFLWLLGALPLSPQLHCSPGKLPMPYDVN